MSIPFQTIEKINEDGGDPLIKGRFLDVGVEMDKEEAIVKAIRAMQKESKEFKPPFMVLDLAPPKDVAIEPLDGGEAVAYPEEGLEEGELVSEDYNQNRCVKVLVPCSQIVDLTRVSGIGGTNSVIKCNAMIPVYRWFQAANLMLHYADKTGRFVPFPLDHEKGTTYHMLPVNPSEFQLYQQILDFGKQQEGPMKGFETAGKFAYELLMRRGIKEISAEEVDKLISHVMLGHNGGKVEGILLHRASRSDLDELKESHFVYY